MMKDVQDSKKLNTFIKKAGGPYINSADTSGAPFMQSHRMSGHSRKARTAFV
jgi:hypothetical protein